MSSSQAKKCGSFYKLLLPSILQEKRLKIPKKFVRKYGHELSGVATLIVPNDRVWIVTLREIDRELWLSDGWNEFVEHYSICIGHFLFFKYEGDANFSVHMYVLTPYDIKHRITTIETIDDHDEVHSVFKQIEDDEHVHQNEVHSVFKQIEDDEHVHQNSTFKSCQNIFSKPNPKECTNGHGEANRNQPVGVKFNTCEVQNSADDMRWGFLDKKLQKLVKTVTISKSCKPAKVHNLSGEGKLHLSTGASASDVADQAAREATVQFSIIDNKNSAYEVKLCSPDGKIQNQPKKCGRKKLKVDPNQQYTTQREDELDMSFGFYKRASGRKRTATAEERKRAINAAIAFEPINPFCMVVLRPSYLYRGCMVHLPSCFAEKHLCGVSEFIKLQFSNGKQWLVRCLYREGKAKLGQGWYEFALENNLEEGDVCIFELLKSRDIVLKVTVFRVFEGVGDIDLDKKNTSCI